MEHAMDVHLRWNNHQTTLLSVFSSLLGNGNLVDCTITAEGQYFKAHRVILSACSPYFELIFSEHNEKHPIVILPDVKFQILKVLMEFMYSGEVEVPENKLCTVLELAEALQIKGLSSAGGSEIEKKLGPKKRNESATFCDQQGSRKHLCDSTYGCQVEQKEDASQLHTSEKMCSEDIDSHLLTTQKYHKGSSNSVSPEKTVGEPPMSQYTSDTEASNMFQCSSLTKTHTKSDTQVSGALLNSVPNILDSSRLPGPSKENFVQDGTLSESVISRHSCSEELKTWEHLGTCGEKITVDLVPSIKEEDADGFNGNSIEEIILDDGTDESDDHDYGTGDDNSNTVGKLVRMIPEESFSGQSICSLEQFRDTYFVEPASILPNQLKCDACGKSYRYRSGLWRHLKYQCGKEPQFRCPHCPSRFTSKATAEMHIGRKHLPYHLQTVKN